MDVNRLLDKLRKVKANGRGKWLACCPAHEDKTPSLAIRQADDRILVHCFSGCGAADVIAAAGMEFGDLFPEPLPQTEHARPRIRQPFSADDALRCLARESGVIAVAAADISDGRRLTAADSERVNLAMGRITEAAGYVYG